MKVSNAPLNTSCPNTTLLHIFTIIHEYDKCLIAPIRSECSSMESLFIATITCMNGYVNSQRYVDMINGLFAVSVNMKLYSQDCQLPENNNIVFDDDDDYRYSVKDEVC